MEEKGRELGRKVDATVGHVQAEAERTSTRLDHGARRVRERLVVAKDKVAHGVQNGRDKVTQHVHDHPMRTLLYAFGAGAAVGLLARRKRRGD